MLLHCASAAKEHCCFIVELMHLQKGGAFVAGVCTACTGNAFTAHFKAGWSSDYGGNDRAQDSGQTRDDMMAAEPWSSTGWKQGRTYMMKVEQGVQCILIDIKSSEKFAIPLNPDTNPQIQFGMRLKGTGTAVRLLQLHHNASFFESLGCQALHLFCHHHFTSVRT